MSRYLENIVEVIGFMSLFALPILLIGMVWTDSTLLVKIAVTDFIVILAVTLLTLKN